MVWAKLDDGWHDDPKIMAAGPEARALHATAINYCAKHLTDGKLSEPVAQHLAGLCVVTATATDLLDRMVEHALFEEEIDRDAVTYRVHNFLAYHPSNAQVQARRKAESEAGKKGADIRWNKPPYEVPHGVPHGQPYPGPDTPGPARPDLDPVVRGTSNKVSLRQGSTGYAREGEMDASKEKV